MYKNLNSSYHVPGTEEGSAGGGWGVLINLPRSSYKVQFYFDVTGGLSRIYQRSYTGSAWIPWNRIYDESILTDSTILSSLASALGVGLKKIIYGGTLPNIWTGEVVNASALVLVWDGNNVQDYWIGIIHSTNAANLWKSEVSGFASKSISLVSQSYSVTKIQTTSSNPDFHYFAYRLI